jgi:hypothetical protein
MGVRISQLDAAATTDYLDGSEFMMNGADGSTKRANLADLKSTFFCSAYCTRITIPSAEVLTLNSVPVEVIEAPGAGYAVQVLSASMKMVFNSSGYTTNTSLVLVSSGAGTEEQFAFASGALSSLVDTFTIATNSANQSVQIIENDPIMAQIGIGDPLAGDSDIELFIYYRLLSV